MMIEVERVSKSFRGARVLDDLSLEVADRDRIALVGSNGAGKTTLIRCLLGEYNHEGEIRIGGISPRRNRRDVLARVGFVPQLPPPLGMPVGELIRFSAGVTGVAAHHFEGVAERLGLDVGPLRGRSFVKLSGGQKQKLLISIALGRETDLLIMDEPAANLDPPARNTLFQLLAERTAGAMIVSSHRLDEVSALVNRVLELDQGRLVLDDHVADAVDPAGVLACRIGVGRREAAFEKAMAEWGFRTNGEARQWEGNVAGPDRLRFLGMISRYAGLLTDLEFKDRSAEGEKT